MTARVQAILTVICLIGTVGSFFVPALGWVGVTAGGVVPLRYATAAIFEKRVSVSVLMVLAAAGALIVGQVTDAGILLFLFSLSGTMEEYALGKTKSAIEALIKLRPETALRITEAGDTRVPTADLAPGDHIRVLAFEAFPVDGKLTVGTTHANEASMTGESMPVNKATGDNVFGGTQNLEGMCQVEVTAAVGHTALDKIVVLVQDAQENKASGERVSQWFGARYTLFVVAMFVVALLARAFVFGQPFAESLEKSVVLLVALSPCALVISTPAATLSALAAAARRGALVRGGQFLERLGEIKNVAIDKTGTLTNGKPELVEICVCSPVAVGSRVCLEESACWHGAGELPAESSRMLRLAAAAEQYSTHPIAEAIVAAARQKGIDVPEALEQYDTPGFGVVSRLSEETVRIGQRKFFEDLPDDFVPHVTGMQSQGLTVAIMEVGGAFAALGLRDNPRNDSQGTISALQKSGIGRIVMLTGDTEQTAAAISGEVGITEWRAALLPSDKEAIIAELESHAPTMMVGDGINDAPSLARASVGVAMGGLGSDVALEAADIVLMNDKITLLPELIRFGRRTRGIILTNLIFASAVILCLMIGSLFFKLPLWLAVVGHEGSTVIVVLNGLRLLRF